jgi:type I restriction enzyme S subunit
MIKELILEKNSLPVGWELKNLLEVSNVLTGKHNANHSKKDGKYRFYTCAYEHLFCDTKKFKGECLIFPGNGANVGEVFYFDGEFDAYQRTYVIFDIKINARYLHYHMLLYWRELGTKLQYGSATNFIKIGNFQDYEVSVPPKNQQKQIVDTLDKAFAAIDTAKANAEQNLQNAKELFESYLQNVFENKGDDWEEKTLGDVLQKTETVNPKSTPNNEFVYLDVSSVNKETKLIEKTTTLLGKDAPSRARKLVKTNDIIFATVRPTHSRVAIITDEYNNQVCSTGYYVLRPKSIIENHYLFYFILTFSFNKLMESMQKGASYPAVNNKEVESVVINFPKSIKEQQKIVERLDSLSTETKKLEAIYTQKIADLEEMKKSVLQKAFSGQLNTIN